MRSYSRHLHHSLFFASHSRFPRSSRPRMNIPKFNEREKALEDDYIRRKEWVDNDSKVTSRQTNDCARAEKFKSSAPQPGGSERTQPATSGTSSKQAGQEGNTGK